MKTIHQLILFPPLIFLLNSCITIGGSKDPQPAKNLEYSSPTGSYVELKSKTGDKSWKSSKTNNVISYLSDCAPNQDPSLDQLDQDALAGLEKMEIKTREEIQYNQRTGRNTVAEGFIDGVKVKINVLSFKKNNCSYSLIYGGVSDRFDSEAQVFKQFTESFKAP